MNSEGTARGHYRVLGLDPGATRKEVERAYWATLAAARGPGAAEEGTCADEAYLTLSDPERRRRYDRMLGLERHPAWRISNSDEARAAFERCLVFLARDQGRKALGPARRAVALDPACPRYRSYLALLIARTGGSLRRAVALAQGAHEEDPGRRDVALNLAVVLEAAGLNRRARALRRRWPSGLARLLRRSRNGAEGGGRSGKM